MKLDVYKLWPYGGKKLKIILNNKEYCEGIFEGYKLEADNAMNAEAITLRVDDTTIDIPIFEITAIEVDENEQGKK